MRYNKISNDLFKKNRAKFGKQMKANSIALFHSNDEMPYSGDASFPFRQNADVFYLTGVGQEETLLCLFPDCPNPKFREALFVRRTNPTIAVWEGAKLNKEQATEVSGVENVYWYDEWEGLINSIMFMSENIYLNLNENDRFSNKVPYNALLFAKKIKEKYPLHNIERSAPEMGRLRSVKENEEVELIQEACNITNGAFRRVLSFVKPGVTEYEIEAEVIHEFVKNKSRGHAYTPIIASGYNACVLHYIENKDVCMDGDIILFDFGADYANYAADMSRSIPVNGKFTPRQNEVYNAVLNVKKAATKLLKPGADYTEYHKQVGELMTEELVNLNLITMDEVRNAPDTWPAYKKYFMHGTSHHLGIDVHDFALKWEPMQAGNVFTVEPGIYIPEENLGIRLEDDVLITDNGIVNLMGEIPIEVEEIESLMNS
jgi:Xaa-Pro aminopeptidase